MEHQHRQQDDRGEQQVADQGIRIDALTQLEGRVTHALVFGPIGQRRRVRPHRGKVATLEGRHQAIEIRIHREREQEPWPFAAVRVELGATACRLTLLLPLLLARLGLGLGLGPPQCRRTQNQAIVIDQPEGPLCRADQLVDHVVVGEQRGRVHEMDAGVSLDQGAGLVTR